MLKLNLPNDLVIEEIAFAKLRYKRPRVAGCNARLGVHGIDGDVWIAQIKAGGITGFGWSKVSREKAQSLVGCKVKELFSDDGMLREEFYDIEFPILDLCGKLANKPVYQLVSADPAKTGGGSFTVPAYDTSIYFDEFHIADDKEAVAFLVDEVRQGMARGHRNFKVKVGRGGFWMDVDKGTQRDIDAVLAIREIMAPDAYLMADANNGFNYNLTKRFLAGSRAAKLFWLEEAFHEDAELYKHLKEWMKKEELDVLIADGEGLAAPVIVNWAQRGLVDVLQYDMRDYGFFRWLKLAARLDEIGIYSAPHNYSGFYGNFAQIHLAAAIKKFSFAEWDEAEVEEIDTSGYSIKNGMVSAPDKPGFGLKLDDEAFMKRVGENGFSV